jgi:uncharacterized YigZ family protein
MNYPDQIKTIRNSGKLTYKERKSVFISEIYPASTGYEAERIIKAIRKKYYDASHHCFAFKLADGQIKSSDGGEPGGTAGIRILNAIEHFELFNIILIVSRYFGGVKLGTGNLGKAYYTAAHSVIENAEIIEKKLFQKIQIKTNFELVNLVHKILSTYNAVIQNTEYGQEINLSCLITPKYRNEILNKLNNQSKKKVQYELKDEYSYL